MAFIKKSFKTNDAEFQQRERWSNKCQFVMATMSYGIGLGNIWRFPSMCYKHGGAAFLIPYFTMLILFGLPILYLEVAIGQYFSTGPITAWSQICPIFKGIGYGTMTLTFILNTYYVVVVVWSLVYFYHSFSTVLPWTTCDNSWNSLDCLTIKDSTESFNTSQVVATNSHIEFFEKKVLQKSADINNPDGLQPELMLALLFIWIVSFFCIWKGVKSTGKVVYFTAVAPLAILLILLIRSVTLPGAIIGIEAYIVPDFGQLANWRVWQDAILQVAFSYGLGIGCWTALGSYNKFNNNFTSQIYVFTVMNFLTSFIGGFTVFSFLGYMAHEQGVSIDSMGKAGTEMAFVTFARALSTMPFASLWSIMFFGTILLLGFGSQMVSVDCFVTAIVDLYPDYLRFERRRQYFIAALCSVSFLVGLSMVTRGGIYVFSMFDIYGASAFSIFLFLFLQVLVVAWIYKSDRFCQNIKEMIGSRVCCGYRICWNYITPIIIGIFLLYYTYLHIQRLSNSRDPTWVIVFNWALTLSSIVMLPIGFLVAFMKGESWSNQSPIDSNRILKSDNILV